ncbi:hypothetical protein [Brucella anthropi]|uniref:hypothetical protein n=1 Tax=Brucella anthropi TaxID=529 RepID=UPI00398765E0
MTTPVTRTGICKIAHKEARDLPSIRKRLPSFLSSKRSFDQINNMHKRLLRLALRLPPGIAETARNCVLVGANGLSPYFRHQIVGRSSQSR